MTLPTLPMGSVTTIDQQFYRASLPPINLELLELSSLTTESVYDLIATLDEGARLGVAASYGAKCILQTLAFSTETRVLLIMVDVISNKQSPQKNILRDELLCNVSLEKHGFFMERIAAALYQDLGLCIRNAFDIESGGDRRGSMAAYKAVIVRGQAQHPVKEPVVERIFAEQPFILSRKEDFALRAWACFIGVQRLPSRPGAIDTSVKVKGLKARSKLLPTPDSHLTPPPDRSWNGCANASATLVVWTP